MLKKRICHHLNQTMFLLTILVIVNFNSAMADESATANDSTQAPTQSEQTSMGSVYRAVFTSQIIDREPADALTIFTNDKHRIYFFTDLRGLAGEIITHRWEHNGQVMAEVKFKVGEGPRWRVYSSKNLLPEWIGEWTVTVVDESGHTLASGAFEYAEATTQEQPQPSEMPVEGQAP